MSARAGCGEVLHARARQVPVAATAVLGAALLSWSTECWSASLNPRERPDVLLLIVVVTPLIAAVALSLTLAGPDVDLEATSPRLSCRGRAVRGIVMTVLTASALGGAVSLLPAGVEGPVLVRNTAGQLGTVLLAVTVLPAVLAWTPAFVYTAFTFLITPRPPTLATSVWSYLVQPVRLDASWFTAAGLLTAGIVTYAVRGPRRGRP
jgi:hypothetical protein